MTGFKISYNEMFIFNNIAINILNLLIYFYSYLRFDFILLLVIYLCCQFLKISFEKIDFLESFTYLLIIYLCCQFLKISFEKIDFLESFTYLLIVKFSLACEPC